ncbi:hypothetical protein HN873_012419 [Arachis hypogaea]
MNSVNNSSLENIDNIVEINNIRSHIAIPIYEKDLNYETDSNYYPIKSQVLSVIIKEEPFEINKKWIKQDFNADYNKLLRDWYVTNYSKNEVIRIRELFYDYMKENRIKLYFFIESKYPLKESVKILVEKNLEVEATPIKITMQKET